MTVRCVLGLALTTTVVIVGIAVGCAARRNASDLETGRESEMEQRGELAAEELLREQDDMRVESFQDMHREMQELQREMDERLLALEEETEEQDEEMLEPEPPGFRERMGKALETAGLVTYTVFTVVFSLGLTALPFLI